MMKKCNQLPGVDGMANDPPNANVLSSQFTFE